jgi:hypothetical protein
MKRLAAIHVLACLATACLIEGWLVGGSAHASCGDYVMVGGHTAHGEHGMPDGDHQLAHGEHSSPCHGPNCSQRSAPSPSQPATVPAGPHDWCLATGETVVLCVRQEGLVRIGSKPTTILRAEPIFRPPRQR